MSPIATQLMDSLVEAIVATDRTAEVLRTMGHLLSAETRQRLQRVLMY